MNKIEAQIHYKIAKLDLRDILNEIEINTNIRIKILPT